MKTYLLTVSLTEGDIEVTFRCDYDLQEAIKVYEVIGGLIGIKPSKGPMKWYVGGLSSNAIMMWREEAPYAGSAD